MEGQNRTPWHLWLVGALSLLWNGFGATDFTLSVTRGEAWYRMMGMTDAQIAEFARLPTWMWLAWALGVYGAILGSVLLLLRRRWAIPAFAISLVAAMASLLYQVAFAGQDPSGPVFPAVIVAIAAFLLWYVWTLGRQGVLR